MNPSSRSSAAPLTERMEKSVKRAVAIILRSVLTAHPVPFEADRIRKILVVRQHDQLGDMICVVPLLRTLREHFPEAAVTLLASPVNYRIMLGNPYAGAVINYDKAAIRRSPVAAWKFYRQLRSEKFDLAVVPATVSLSLTSDVLAILSGARFRVGARSLNGTENPTSPLFSHSIDLDWSNDLHRHQARRNCDILLALEKIPAPDLRCALGLLPGEREGAEKDLAEFRKNKKFLVGIHPGAGKAGNRWPAERFAAVADALALRYDAGIVVTAGSMDDDVIEKFRRHAKRGYLLFHNRPIRDVAAIIDCLDLFLSNDTGIMHIAGGLQPKLLALFGPTDPLQWAPTGEKNRFIAAATSDITEISVETVLAAFQEMIS